MLVADPILTYARKLRVLPIAKKSKTDAVDPNLMALNTENALPILPTPRRDITLPKCKASRIEKFDPIATLENTLILLATRV